jgi:phenylacetate-CoA ligase
LGRIDQATKVRGLFIHPRQVDEIASRHPVMHRVQVMVTRKENKDVMTFRIELKENVPPLEPLKETMERSIRDVMKLRGEVQFLPRGTIPEGSKTIEDQRTWD